jgi:hypothetical protein
MGRFQGNCGSVTPGVLRFLVPCLGSIRSFSLGLSYSLEDGHVLEFLSQLPLLENLTLRYYWVSPTTSKSVRTFY